MYSKRSMILKLRLLSPCPLFPPVQTVLTLGGVLKLMQCRWGLFFAPEPGGQVPPSDTPSHLSSSSTVPTTSTASSSSQADPPLGRRGGRKPKKGGYEYTVCGKKRDRKSDLDGHLWTACKIGFPIQCNIPPCENKDFATRGSLKLHQKTKHQKEIQVQMP